MNDQPFRYRIDKLDQLAAAVVLRTCLDLKLTSSYHKKDREEAEEWIGEGGFIEWLEGLGIDTENKERQLIEQLRQWIKKGCRVNTHSNRIRWGPGSVSNQLETDVNTVQDFEISESASAKIAALNLKEQDLQAFAGLLRDELMKARERASGRYRDLLLREKMAIVDSEHETQLKITRAANGDKSFLHANTRGKRDQAIREIRESPIDTENGKYLLLLDEEGETAVDQAIERFKAAKAEKSNSDLYQEYNQEVSKLQAQLGIRLPAAELVKLKSKYRDLGLAFPGEVPPTRQPVVRVKVMNESEASDMAEKFKSEFRAARGQVSKQAIIKDYYRGNGLDVDKILREMGWG